MSLEHTKSLLVRIKDILDNKEHYVTINKKDLYKISKYRNVNLLSKTGEYNASSSSCSDTSGSLNGGFSGHSFLGCGSIGGNISGNLDSHSESHSNAHYQEDIIVKITYNLDYEIEDYMLDNITFEEILDKLDKSVWENQQK